MSLITVHAILENTSRMEEWPDYGTNKQDIHHYIQGTEVQDSPHWDKNRINFPAPIDLHYEG